MFLFYSNSNYIARPMSKALKIRHTSTNSKLFSIFDKTVNIMSNIKISSLKKGSKKVDAKGKKKLVEKKSLLGFQVRG